MNILLSLLEIHGDLGGLANLAFKQPARCQFTTVLEVTGPLKSISDAFRPLKYADLVAQSQVLELEGGARANHRR